MKCPFCGAESDKVVDSRAVRDGTAIRRRRECQSCNERFTTYEYIERAEFTVVKGDQRRESYNRAKLLRGVEIATAKRPISAKVIHSLVEDVENELFKLSRAEISSKLIGEYVMDRLRNLDQVAYVRFASVYRKFKDIEEFTDELKNLP